MRHVRRLLTLLGPLALAACGGHDDYYYPGYAAPPPGTYANFQVINASPDAPPITFQLDGATLLRRLDYGQGTGEQPITPTSHSLVIQIDTPGSPTTVIGPSTLNAAANMDYVVAVEGNVPIGGVVQPDGMTAVVFPHTLAVVPTGSTQIQVLNAVVGTPLNVYLTTPGADLASSAPLGSVAFEGSLGPTQVQAGTWEIRITASSGASAPVVYDSGTISLQGGTDLVIAILERLLPQPTALPLPTGPTYQLVAVDASGHNTWLPAVGTWALLQVVQDSPDAPALAVVANDDVTTPLVPSLSYEASSGYLAETPGAYALAVTPANNLTDVLASQRIQLDPGTAHTLYATGLLAQPLAFVTHDSYRRYANLARLRFIQGAPSANRVDVYLTGSGSTVGNATPTYAGLPFTADTGFVSYAEGAYELTVTAAGSKTPIIGPVAITLANDGIYTAVARDAPGGGAPYGLISLDDL
jgi:hypothetical protein